jgi:hypothetical protein
MTATVHFGLFNTLLDHRKTLAVDKGPEEGENNNESRAIICHSAN